MFKKGDRVEYDVTENGKPTIGYGVVRKGTTKPNGKVTVVMDGGNFETTGVGPDGGYRLSKHPLPVDEPSVMDKWSITRYKNTGFGDETPQFNAEIALNGKVVILARNSGQGGCNMYYRNPPMPIDGGIEQFIKDATEWGKQFGYPYDFEAHDTWVEWAAREKIYGVLAVDYFKKY